MRTAPDAARSMLHVILQRQALPDVCFLLNEKIGLMAPDVARSMRIHNVFQKCVIFKSFLIIKIFYKSSIVLSNQIKKSPRRNEVALKLY